MSTFCDRMRGLSAAEEFFALLDVPYDPTVLNVARLHILRRMGDYMSEDTLAAMTEDAAREACRLTLMRAYEDFVTSSPLKQRVFKVLREAVAPNRGAFVPLSALTADEA